VSRPGEATRTQPPAPGPSPPRGQVAEVFRSYQGEGLLLGRRQVFVRLAGCTVGCRYCDTEWAFVPPVDLARPGGRERLRNPLAVEQVLALVEAADPGGSAPVSLTGGEPLEQADFAAALVVALGQGPRPREVMLETSALHSAALARLLPLVRWIAADLKLPSATGRVQCLQEHEAAFAGGVLAGRDVFFKLVVDGDTPDEEVAAAGALIARHAPRAPVFLQPVTPLGGSPALPNARLDALVDRLAAAGLEVRVVPQVHKILRVR